MRIAGWHFTYLLVPGHKKTEARASAGSINNATVTGCPQRRDLDHGDPVPHIDDQRSLQLLESARSALDSSGDCEVLVPAEITAARRSIQHAVYDDTWISKSELIMPLNGKIRRLAPGAYYPRHSGRYGFSIPVHEDEVPPLAAGWLGA